MQDVRLEIFDPFFDGHLREFVWLQVGEFHARLMNGRQLLLLVHLIGHVAHGDDQMLAMLLAVINRRGMHLVVLVICRAER